MREQITPKAAIICSYPLKQFLYGRGLTSAGFNVTLVTDNVRDLRNTKGSQIDCILVDLNVQNTDLPANMLSIKSSQPNSTLVVLEEDHDRVECGYTTAGNMVIHVGKRVCNQTLKALLAKCM